MTTPIVLYLLQDGVINGAIYALLAISLLLVFSVTRVIFVPQGEFLAYGALTLAALEAGRVPGTAWLLIGLGCAAAVLALLRERGALSLPLLARIAATDILMPLLLLILARWIAPMKLGLPVEIALTLALVIPMGPLIYRLAFEPMAEASTLVLLIAAIGVSLAMTGLALVFFGPEGSRTTPFTDLSLQLSVLKISGQSLCVLGVTVALLGALYVFFELTLAGKALRATAVNRLGARLVGIPVATSGRRAFAMAAAIGALSGLLIGPFTTITFDSGFLIGLKGFVAAIIGGLVSYPWTALAALAIGLLESFAAFQASAFKEVIVFTIIIPVLLWRSLRRSAVEDEE